MTVGRVTVVGLGPGNPQHVTAETLAVIDAAEHRFVRTARHPSASLVGGATSFDDLYERADSFEEVYAEIVERLVAAAGTHGEVLYAVPGSPLVLERTVALLRADARISCRTLAGLSFLDLAYARLGIDPIEAGVRLVDGHRFAEAAAGDHGPLLVAHTHANWLLSEIKLAVDEPDEDTPVTILQRLGTAGELIVETTWPELDRTVEADHLTSLYIPRLAAPVAAEGVRLHRLTRTLREQCPWDRQQTHASLTRYLVEETYEVVDALQALDAADPATDEALIEELGDLLYQIELHATIAEEQHRFNFADVARGVHDKLIRRHPHVFGTVQADDAAAVERNWEQLKRAEKRRGSALEGVPASLPALAYAEALQRKAAKAGFDWPSVDGAVAKIAEEAAELADAAGDGGDVASELGDLLFAVVNVARHLGVEPETALRAGANKFRRRFEAVEQLAAQRAVTIDSAGLAALDALWDEVKAAERS